MATCCTDTDALFLYDFEDGAPLTTYFDNFVNGAVANSSTGGINNSRSAVSANRDDEFSRTYSDGNDRCGNPRRAFGVAFYYRAVGGGNGFFYLCEVRDSILSSGPVGETIVSIQRDDSQALVVFNGTSSDEVLRINNVFLNDGLYKIEARGQISSYDPATGDSGSDGSVEVRINGRVYFNGDDFSAIDPQSDPGPCKAGVTGVNWPPSADGWNRITFGFPAASENLDCLAIFETSKYCNWLTDPTLPPGPCDPPGPGGDPSGPRIVHPGGYPMTPGDYVAPTTGGVPFSTSDPNDPQSATAVSLISFDLTLCDGSVRRYAQVDGVPQSGRAAADGRVVRFGPVAYALSDRFGAVKAQQWDVELADPDGQVRTDLSDSTNRFYKRWTGQLFGESDAARLAGTSRVSLARGRVITVNTETPLVVKLTLGDELNYPSSPFSLDRQLPHVLIGDLFQSGLSGTGLSYQANCPADVAKDGLPLIFGEASDDRRLLENPPLTPIGICKLRYVGDFTLTDGQTWRGFAVCLYACKKIVALFGSNQDPNCPGSVRLDPDVFSSGAFLAPGQGSWSTYFATNYNDLTINSATYRTTMIFGRGPVADAHVDGTVPLSVNVWGKETVGDGSGTLITDGAYIADALLEWAILQRAKLGNESASTFADTVPKINRTSIAAVKTIHDARLTSGYPGALIVDGLKAGRDWLAAVLVSYGLRTFANRYGQIELTAFDDTQGLGSPATFLDVTDIRGDTFKTTSEIAGELENGLTYDYGPEPATGRQTGGPLTLTAAQSVSNWSDTSDPFKGDDRHLLAVYTAAVASDVIGRQLVQTQDGITRGEIAVDLSGFGVKPGQIFEATDFRGLGATGWTDRVLLADTVTFNPNLSAPPQEDDLGVTLAWEDVDPILVQNAVIAQVGLEADSTAAVVGSESAGTAYRAG